MRRVRSPKASHRFPILDAMRGLAALSVVLLHIEARSGKTDVPHALLAVDFFFMLSGFVLTLAYQKRLDSGWSLGAFLQVRLIRLYPLYALGLALGVVAAWRFSTIEPIPSSTWWTHILMSVFLLPILPGMTGGGAVFLFNNPSWSLFMELVANVFHALFLRRSLGAVKALLALSGAGMVWVLVKFGFVYVGMFTDTLFYGVLRVLFSYCLGILLFHLWERGTIRLKAPPFLLGSALLCALALPKFSHGEALYDVFVILILFPWLLLAGATSELPAKYLGTANFLGLTSYAVYILHEPVLWFWAPVMNRLGWHGAKIGSVWGVPCLLMVCLIAWLADRLYDEPVRAFLRRIFLSSESRVRRVEG